ncbi:hypothetical protein TorRG33x02_175480, partial [Trema orientale]
NYKSISIFSPYLSTSDVNSAVLEMSNGTRAWHETICAKHSSMRVILGRAKNTVHGIEPCRTLVFGHCKLTRHGTTLDMNTIQIWHNTKDTKVRLLIF